MNLKEEILKKADGRTVISITEAAVIADSYAKEKAWGAWVTVAMQDSANDLSREPMIFNDWWEETKSKEGK